jgi:hypothetical protein
MNVEPCLNCLPIRLANCSFCCSCQSSFVYAENVAKRNTLARRFYGSGDIIRVVGELNHALQTSARSNEGFMQEAQTNAPFWKATAFVLWVLALCGVFLVLPYAATLENKALAATAARTHLKVWELLAISVVQTAILLAICGHPRSVGSTKTKARDALIAALLTGKSKPKRSLSTLLVAFVLGTG